MTLTPEWAAIAVAAIAFFGTTVKSYFDSQHLKRIGEVTATTGQATARIEIQTDSRLTEALAKIDDLTDRLAKAKIINIEGRVDALEALKKANGHEH
jgi:hypothetical protein